MTKTTSQHYYFTALLFTLCIMSSFATSPHSNKGTLTVYVNTTTRYNGVIGEFTRESILFDFTAEDVNKGSFTWDNVWSFKPFGAANFELSDKDNNVIYVRPHNEEDFTRDLGAILALSAHNRAGRLESVASHIGNSVNKAYLRLKKAETIGNVVGERVAAEVAGQVAKNITSEIMHGIETGVRAENSAWKTSNKQYFSAEVGGFKSFANRISI